MIRMMELKYGWVLMTLSASLAAFSPVRGAPELRVADAPGPALKLELLGTEPGEIWTLQDSYDSIHWRDLDVIDSRGRREVISEAVPVRLFRAARKSPATPQEALDQARERWAVAGPSTYMYLYESGGEFGFLQQLVSVANGSVVEATVIGPAEFPQVAGPGRTISDLLSQIQAAIDGDAYAIFARYHPTCGYPESVFIDYSEFIADEEWSFSIRRAPEIPLPALERNAAWWSRHAPSAYQYHLKYQTAWWGWEGVIRVRDGVAEILSNGTQGEPSSDKIIQPLDALFELIRNAIEGESILSVLYDEALGFPVFISDNWHWTFFDGPGERYWISDFQVLESP